MLMCLECHKYIDNEGKGKYTAQMLFDMKSRHEERIARLISIGEDLQAHVVTYGSKVGDQQPDFSFFLLQDTLLSDYYPVSDDSIDLGSSLYIGREWEEYWKKEIEHLEFTCKDLVLDKIRKWEHKRIALFGLVPMLLLVKLGTMLNNKHEVEVYQKQRTGGCKWLQDEITDYIINRPKET